MQARCCSIEPVPTLWIGASPESVRKTSVGVAKPISVTAEHEMHAGSRRSIRNDDATRDFDAWLQLDVAVVNQCARPFVDRCAVPNILVRPTGAGSLSSVFIGCRNCIRRSSEPKWPRLTPLSPTAGLGTDRHRDTEFHDPPTSNEDSRWPPTLVGHLRRVRPLLLLPLPDEKLGVDYNSDCSTRRPAQVS